MKLIHHVRSQPEHIRHVWAGACTVVVAVFIIAVWAHSFKQNLYTLLNPDEQTQNQERNLAANTQSLFGSIGETFKGATAAIGQVWDQLKGPQAAKPAGQQVQSAAQADTAVHPLPVSGNR